MLGAAAAAIGCLLAGHGSAEDPAPPDEALLEFLGSFSEAEDDWFEFLAIMSGTAGEDDEEEEEERHDDSGAP